MKKVLFLLLLFLNGVAVSIKAQVSIGEKKIPENYSALEIISNGSNGLRLPQLTTTQRNALADEIKAITDDDKKKLAEGLVIFNKETKCMDYWNGTKWVSLCLGSAQINLPNDASGNYKLSGKTGFDVSQTTSAGCGATENRPNDFASTKSFTYTFIGSGHSDLHFMVLDTNSLVSNTTATLNKFTVTFKDNIASLAAGTTKTTAKKLTIIAQYKDNTGAYKQVSLVVSVQDCACGCSVRSTLPAGWLTFMCHNLGADETMSIADQMNHTPTGDTDSIVYGALYQWGRKADGHQKRTSPRYLTDDAVQNDGALATAALDGNGQVPIGHDAYGKFIKQNSGNSDWRITQCDTLWKDGVKTLNDPCPTGWRVPTNNEWNSITKTFSGTLTSSWQSAGTSGNKVRWNESSNTPGLEISAGDTNVALFLPAAGYRDVKNGSFSSAGSDGLYWSSTFTDNYLTFNSNDVYPDGIYNRGFGFSVRCVAE